MERDLFGSILFIALRRKVDMGMVLQYPLTPIPLSLCHVDGSMNTTSNSLLRQELEKRSATSDPSSIDVLILDAMFYLHLLPAFPCTYGASMYLRCC